MSMITSFGALVYFGLQFNERDTNGWTKWLLCFPMFAANVASRGFTLAVFLKEVTLSSGTADVRDEDLENVASYRYIELLAT